MKKFKISYKIKREFHVVSVGSTQDARATLIGNTSYKKETGTVFHKSAFVKAITTPNAIILLDEFSRGTHDAHNILMPVIDPTQRCLRLDEDEESLLIKVAPDVTFIATANIGNEYTATKVLDKATMRRFPIKIEMSPLSGEELNKLFGIVFKSRTKEETKLMETLSEISDDIIAQTQLEDASINSIIPAANMMELCELVMDGFNLQEIAECGIYPEYSDDGTDGERTFVKSILQKFFPRDVKNPMNDPLRK